MAASGTVAKTTYIYPKCLLNVYFHENKICPDNSDLFKC